MVKRKIEIKAIEDNAKRHTTYVKRRKGLMKKTEEFCNKSESMALVIAFSKAGKCHTLGHPHVDIVLNRYEAECSSSREREEEAPLTEMQKRIGEAMKNWRWDDAVRGLGYQEYVEFVEELQRVRRMMREARIAAEEEERKAAAAEEEERKTAAEEESKLES